MTTTTHLCPILRRCAEEVEATNKDALVDMIYCGFCASAYLVFVTIAFLQAFQVACRERESKSESQSVNESENESVRARARASERDREGERE